MKLTIDEDFNLTYRGKAIGKIRSIDLELDSDAILSERSERTSTISRSSNPDVQTGKRENQVKEIRPTPSQKLKADVDECWAYYLEVVPSRRKLDAKRRRFLEGAIKLVGVDSTKLAILGLSRSPWHNGANPQRKMYLDLHYALRGKGDESDDARIEKAIVWAAVYAPNTTAIDEDRVQRLLEDLRYTASLPHKPEYERAKAAYRALIAAGFKVTMLDKAPWVRLER